MTTIWEESKIREEEFKRDNNTDKMVLLGFGHEALVRIKDKEYMRVYKNGCKECKNGYSIGKFICEDCINKPFRQDVDVRDKDGKYIWTCYHYKNGTIFSPKMPTQEDLDYINNNFLNMCTNGYDKINSK